MARTKDAVLELLHLVGLVQRYLLQSHIRKADHSTLQSDDLILLNINFAKHSCFCFHLSDLLVL